VQQQQGPQTQAPRALSTWQHSCSCILLPLSYMQSVVLLLIAVWQHTQQQGMQRLVSPGWRCML
jgi:hypothetical protein